MLNLYKFSAYNSQAMYGWGDDGEAERYCDFLNRGRQVNVYSWSEVTDKEVIARCDSSGEGVNLADALIEIGYDD